MYTHTKIGPESTSEGGIFDLPGDGYREGGGSELPPPGASKLGKYEKII
jgi:hypothetical protein